MSFELTFTIHLADKQMASLIKTTENMFRGVGDDFKATVLSQSCLSKLHSSELSRAYFVLTTPEKSAAKYYAYAFFIELRHREPNTSPILKATFSSSYPWNPGDVVRTQQAFTKMLDDTTASRFVWAAGNENFDRGLSQAELWNNLDKPIEGCWSEPEPGELKDGQRKKINAALAKEGVTLLGDLVQCRVLVNRKGRPHRLKTANVHIMNIDIRSVLRLTKMLNNLNLWFGMDTAGWVRPNPERRWGFTNPTQDPLAYLRL